MLLKCACHNLVLSKPTVLEFDIFDTIYHVQIFPHPSFSTLYCKFLVRVMALCKILAQLLLGAQLALSLSVIVPNSAERLSSLQSRDKDKRDEGRFLVAYFNIAREKDFNSFIFSGLSHKLQEI